MNSSVIVPPTDTTQRHLGRALGGKGGNEAVAQVAHTANVDVAHRVAVGARKDREVVEVLRESRAVAPPCGARQILPLRSCSFMSGRLYCLASTESKSCWSSATSASAISVFTRLSDKFVKLVLQTTLPVLPAITRQPGFL